MGYSERSLCRLVDKIQDGSANEANLVSHPVGSRTSTSFRAERRADEESWVDFQEDSLLAQGDGSNYESSLLARGDDNGELEHDNDFHVLTFCDTDEPLYTMEEARII